MIKLTPEQMAKRAMLMRVRSEGNILRAFWLNEVVPAIEKEFDRRLANGDNLVLEMPDVDKLAKSYVNQILKSNKQLT